MSLLSLRQLHDDLQRIHKDAQESEREEGPVEYEVDGVKIVSELFYCDRKGSRRSLDFDGYPFATELEYVPWSIFKPVTTSYWIWTDLTHGRVEYLIKATGIEESRLWPMEEFYPTDNGPSRWNAHARDLESVVALWKVWEPKYRPK